MTASQRIKLEIMRMADWRGLPDGEIAADRVDDLWREATDDDESGIYDAENEFRCSNDTETGLPCETSRHYESKSVATELPDGTWVGWTYWYGGGKHGEPDEVEWIDDAYYLDVTEQEQTVVVRTFTKREGEK